MKLFFVARDKQVGRFRLPWKRLLNYCFKNSFIFACYTIYKKSEALIKSCQFPLPIYQRAKNPGSLTPFVAGNCQEPFTFTRIASLLYYIDSPENREGYGKPDLHYTSEMAEVENSICK